MGIVNHLSFHSLILCNIPPFCDTISYSVYNRHREAGGTHGVDSKVDLDFRSAPGTGERADSCPEQVLLFGLYYFILELMFRYTMGE